MVTQTLQWPDVELLAVNYLRAALATEVAKYSSNVPSWLTGVKVGNVPPKGSPITYPLVTTRRAGGVRTGQVFDEARLMVMAWAPSEQDAAALMALVRDLLRLMPGVRDGFTVTVVSEFLGPTPVNDPDTNTPRQMMTVMARIRATART